MIKPFLEFIHENPTSFHVAKSLQQEGKKLYRFKELDERDSWQLKPGGKYLLAKNGTIAAFIMPQKMATGALILASHTDSPSLKLKPAPEIIKDGMILLGVEIYGAPLLNSWLNRDLGIAGRVIFEDKQKEIKEKLVHFDQPLAVIPQLAIHLDRKVNDEGILLDKQEHLFALAGMSKSANASFLLSLLSPQLPLKKLLAHDLFLYPVEKAQFLGQDQTFISGYRLDSLASVYAAKEAFFHAAPDPFKIKLILFTDHEEIGSTSDVGANSPFLSRLLERIVLGAGLKREDYFKLLASSLCVSIDLGHALHPNYNDRHDPQHKALLEGGLLIKTNAGMKYATHANSAAYAAAAASKAKIPYKMVAGRNNIPSGSTVGPLHAAATGISTVDIGIAQLSMHSIREIIAAKDLTLLHQFLQTILTA